MIEYKCQDCGETIGFLNADELKRRLESGEVVEGRGFKRKHSDGGFHVGSEEGIFGICRICRGKDRVLADQAGGNKAADAQMIRIRNHVAEARRMMPRLTIESAVKLAIEDEFDPHREPDRAFRAYLLENYEQSKVERSLWQRVRALFGASV